jgi:PAS domain S-box-containing protein
MNKNTEKKIVHDWGVKTVLLVEDDAIIAMSEIEHLKREGYKILHAANGESALEIVSTENGSIDLILMDIDLGRGIDGTETAERILAVHDIPVIFLSSYIDREIVDKTAEITSYGYVVKDSGFPVLDASINMAFRLFDANNRSKMNEHFYYESEAKYKNLVENINEIVYSFSTKRGALYWSPKAEEILGFSIDDLMSNPKKWFESIHPEDQANVDSVIRDFEEGKAFKTEYRIKDSGGNWHWFVDQSIGRHGEGDEKIIYGTASDITERRNAEQALRESKELLQNITDNMFDFVALVDIRGCFKYLGKSHSILGYEVSDLEGRDASYFIHDDDRHAVQQIFIYAVTHRETRKAEYRFRCGDGSYIWLETIGKIIIDEQGNIKNILLSSRDISERKLMEEELRKSHERLLTIMDNADVLVYIADMQSYELIFINKYGRRVWGENMAGEKCWKVLQGMEGPCHFCTNDRLVSVDGKPKELHQWIFQNSINNRWYDCRDCAIQWTDGRTVRMEIAVDITESKLAEKKIQLLLNEKEIIFKEVNHRIKNNMNAMKSLLYIQSNIHNNPEVKNILLDASNRLQSMTVLYEKLYLSENKQEVSTREFFPALINEIVTVLPKSISIALKTEIDDIYLHAGKLSPLGIIINELITNSIKYAFKNRAEGQISIKVLKRDKRIYVDYSDNGIGLPESVSVGNSSGLGMQLVGLLTKQIGGTINIDRENGARFIIEFDL